MSIQSTTALTRKEAEARWLDTYVARNIEGLRRELSRLSDTELENDLETMFDNFDIVEEQE